MFACNTGAKTPRHNCSKIINMFVGGATIECTYTQDNSAITNLNHEGWTCTGLSQVGLNFKNNTNIGHDLGQYLGHVPRSVSSDMQK